MYTSISGFSKHRFKYLQSLFRNIKASSRLDGSIFIPKLLRLCSDILYIFSLIGLPGSILFLIPSNPAATIAENARYEFADGSGALNSILFDESLPLAFTGIRTTADLLPLAHAT